MVQNIHSYVKVYVHGLFLEGQRKNWVTAAASEGKWGLDVYRLTFSLCVLDDFQILSALLLGSEPRWWTCRLCTNALPSLLHLASGRGQTEMGRWAAVGGQGFLAPASSPGHC